jgi:ADP-heptose:LPS heptosyltransferase
MQPNTMRAVDFWVGIPLCFLLTLVFRLQRLLGLNDPAFGKPPRRILFIQLAEMGTMVVAYPALRKAQELFPGATLHFLCFAQIRSSVEMLGIIDGNDILTIDSSSPATLVRDTVRVLWQARRRGIDAVINLETFVRFSSLLSFLSGARQRVGFHRFNLEGLYTGDLVTHPVMYNAHVHAGHTFLDLVHALATPSGQVPHLKRPIGGDRLDVPKITTDPDTAARLWAKLQTLNPAVSPSHKLVVLNPNASKRFPMRRLPLERYAELAERLLEDPELCVLVTGVADEKPDATFICSRVRSRRIVDLTGETTMTELLHLFNMAQVLVTNDSGPAHFACLTRIHVVVFFGPEIPDRYRPLAISSDVVYSGFSCSPCVSPFNQRLTPCNDNLCLQSVDVAAVCSLVRARLQSQGSRLMPLRPAAAGPLMVAQGGPR